MPAVQSERLVSGLVLWSKNGAVPIVWDSGSRRVRIDQKLQTL